ncbi:unnamed protein product [Onchocerca flexuosa]|uniref:Sorbitol dehydrogenase n=1 Tax=Onchocerca flexuosa TaxID=387005 RepID=A0A183GYL0_9BILA|nr:unnamed protein product [Onchocerca flexuosa]
MVGKCGAGISFWTRSGIGPFQPLKPMIMGHECSGIVSDLGPDVKRFAICRYNYVDVDDTIYAMKWNFLHFHCRWRYAKFFTVGAGYCFKLIQNNMSMEEASFLELLSSGLHVCRKANIGIGSHVLVLCADETVIVKDLSTQETARIIVEKLGEAADVVVECCGAQCSIKFAVKAVKDGGKIMLMA